MNKTAAAADIIIFGGGIAGLWLLNRLRQAGFSVILFESGALGGGQTHKAQGIIHGGMKYALKGIFTREAQAMVDVPEMWRRCLSGHGEIDLSSVPILSPKHYLWSTNKLTSKFAGFLAGTTLTSQVIQLPKEQYPAIFQHPSFKGDVYSLDEMVIDVPILIRELVKENQDAIFKIEPLSGEELKFVNGKLKSATIYLSGKPVEVSGQRFIFTAGAGNEIILKRLKHANIAMQRRPLHMVLVKTPFDYPLYAHCLGFSNRPRITITTHYMQDGSTVWYLGGELSEEGVKLESADQIKAARAELQDLFPWLDFSSAQFASFMIDRAEPKQKNGLKPDSSYSKAIENMIIAWPTKLALTPKLTEEILTQLQASTLTPKLCDIRSLRAWPIPPIAKPIWEDLF